MIALTNSFPRLLRKAIAWAQAQEQTILETGRPLTPRERLLADCVEVRRPDEVRIRMVAQLPIPQDAELHAAATRAGLLGPGMIGLTLGHGIYIMTGFVTARLVSHECRHVYQYERAGSIAEFLPQYLDQVLRFGYRDAPFEVDARNWERS